jgi:hypothetical protein
VVWSQVIVGNTVFATGSFSKARPPGTAVGSPSEVAASNIFAYNLTTGTPVSAFNHSLNAQGLVVASSPDGSRVYVGGDFTMVDGVARNHVVAFITATGALDPSFAPYVSAQVRALAVTSSTLYVGGAFMSAGGATRHRLAAFSTPGGSRLPWAPSADDNSVWSMALATDGSRLVVGGAFTTLNGVAAYGMGAVDVTTGATLPWAANQKIRDAGTYGAITTLVADGTQIYGGGYAYGAGANFEGTFAAAATTGNINWLNDCHGDTYAVWALGPALYSVGHPHDCSMIGAFPETNPRTWHRALAWTTYPTGTNTGPDDYGWNYSGIADSSLLQWFPDIALGSYTGQYQGAWAVTGTASYVVLGGEFPAVNGTAQQGLVRFAVKSLAPNKRGPTPVGTPTVSAVSLTRGTARVTWQAMWDMDNSRLTYDVLRDGKLYVFSAKATSTFWAVPSMVFDDKGLARGSKHTYQIRVTDPFGNTLWSALSNSVTIK